MIRSTFALPLAIAILSLAGLIVALTGEGWRDLLAWLTLSSPILALAWATIRSNH